MKKQLLYIVIVLSVVAVGWIIINAQEPETVSAIVELQEGIYLEKSTTNELGRTYHIKSECSCGQPGQLLNIALWQVKGVQSVYPQPYQFYITISPIFNWEEVQPHIVEMIVKMRSAYNEGIEEAEKEVKEGA